MDQEAEEKLRHLELSEEKQTKILEESTQGLLTEMKVYDEMKHQTEHATINRSKE